MGYLRGVLHKLAAPSLMLCCAAQMGFNEFLHRCEMLDFDFDPKLAQHGRMHTRDMHKLKARCFLLHACRVPIVAPLRRAASQDARCRASCALCELMGKHGSSLAQGDKYASRPVSELDVSTWEVGLPAAGPKLMNPTCLGRSSKDCLLLHALACLDSRPSPFAQRPGDGLRGRDG